MLRKKLSPRNSRFENVRVHTTIVAELEFSDVERQILVADLVEAAHDAALNKRPKTFDCVGVDDSSNAILAMHPVLRMLASTMVDSLVIVFAADASIAAEIISAQQAHAVGNSLDNEGFQPVVTPERPPYSSRDPEAPTVRERAASSITAMIEGIP